METPKRAPADPAKRATALAAVLGWLLSLAAARGVTIDPDVLLQLNTATLSTLSLRVVEKLVVSLSRPLVSGAAALMEVLSRVLLLLLALVLCAAPTHREAILQRARSFLRDHVEVAVRCAHQPSLLHPSPLYAAAPPAAASFSTPCAYNRPQPPLLAAGYRYAWRRPRRHRKRSPSCRPALRRTCWSSVRRAWGNPR